MQASNINTSSKRILANRYKLISELGSGLSSQVFKVLDETTGESKVAKIYEDNETSTYLKEAQIFKMIQQINHPNLIKYYESDFAIHFAKSIKCCRCFT